MTHYLNNSDNLQDSDDNPQQHSVSVIPALHIRHRIACSLNRVNAFVILEGVDRVC
jgi:hypothetical protein